MMFRYQSALQTVNTRIEILNQEFLCYGQYTPIEHIKTRLKTQDSITKKLAHYGVPLSVEHVEQKLCDVAGARIICSFTSDIYHIAERLAMQEDMTIHHVKDYIQNPKSNGYKSYHMVVSVPVYMADGPVQTKVEIQIRTVAMDFWASLEHKIYYKFEGHAPDSLQEELKACADVVDMLDAKMYSLNERIRTGRE